MQGAARRPLGREAFRANLRCSAKGALLQCFGGVSNRAALLEFRNCSVPRNRAGAGAQQAPPVAGFAAPVLRSIASKPPPAAEQKEKTPVPSRAARTTGAGDSAAAAAYIRRVGEQPLNRTIPLSEKGMWPPGLQQQGRWEGQAGAARERSISARKADQTSADQPHARCRGDRES